MRPAHARALSYTIVASLAGLAIWFTPSLGAYRAMPLAPVVVVHPEMPKTDYTPDNAGSLLIADVAQMLVADLAAR